MHILIPALERNKRYDDLQVLMMSKGVYAPLVEAIVAYKGQHPGLWDEDENTTYIQQHDANRCYGDAVRQLIAKSDDDELLIINDDCVLTPTTIPFLLEDIKMLQSHPDIPKLGLIGLRSNFVAGLQNIRTPHGALLGLKYAMENSVVEVNQVFGVAFYVQRSALEAIPDDWTHLNWYSDNLLSYDLKAKGYRHFVSRSYIHHIGAQSTASFEKADQEGKAWLQAHRKDFYDTL